MQRLLLFILITLCSFDLSAQDKSEQKAMIDSIFILRSDLINKLKNGDHPAICNAINRLESYGEKHNLGVYFYRQEYFQMKLITNNLTAFFDTINKPYEVTDKNQIQYILDTKIYKGKRKASLSSALRDYLGFQKDFIKNEIIKKKFDKNYDSLAVELFLTDFSSLSFDTLPYLSQKMDSFYYYDTTCPYIRTLAYNFFTPSRPTKFSVELGINTGYRRMLDIDGKYFGSGWLLDFGGSINYRRIQLGYMMTGHFRSRTKQDLLWQQMPIAKGNRFSGMTISAILGFKIPLENEQYIVPYVGISSPGLYLKIKGEDPAILTARYLCGLKFYVSYSVEHDYYALRKYKAYVYSWVFHIEYQNLKIHPDLHLTNTQHMLLFKIGLNAWHRQTNVKKTFLNLGC